MLKKILIAISISFCLFTSFAQTNGVGPIKLLTAQEITNLVYSVIGSGGTNTSSTLPWYGTSDGNTYHPAMTLVDSIPVMFAALGAGTNSIVLPWYGPSDGNNYKAVSMLVDGVKVVTWQQL